MSARFVALLLTLVSLLALCGCVKYDDSVEIDANGKGSAKIVMSRPVLGVIDKLRAGDEENTFSEEEMKKDLPANVKLSEFTRKEEKERVEYVAVYTFDDINSLIGWAAQRKNHPLRDISVKRSNSTLEFTRSIKSNKDSVEVARKFMPDTVFTFRLKGPGKVEQHNGKLDNGVIVWEVKVADALEKGYDMKAAFFFGTPTWVYALIAFFIIDAIIVAIVLMRKRSSPAAQPTQSV